MQKTINLRVDEELKSTLQELAEIHGYSLSDYTREILLNHVEDFNSEKFTDSIDQEEIDEEEEYYDSDLSIEIPYEKTYAFTCLLTWLFCRRMHPHDNNSKSILTSLKLKVERVLAESSFSNELKLEFLKVLGDLNRYLLEPDSEDKQFQFSVLGNHLSFNYYLLMNEIWSLEIPIL
ncbi:hypothetical protein [uncultured Maribacter sp.]|uniref:hypothetical protein n=1 Tax=uncultured Maribacter sp. TaxID=431308 RepID=UPI0030DA8B41|tara:strand:- start:2054 stop:2584 length:531 start_codon:yes stop_codon:yes gene_type:complete